MDNHSRIYNDISSTDKFDESSDEFKAFLSRVKDLEVKFIPEIKIHEEISSPDYSGDPTQIFDQDIIRAFILLTHAETEDYFESLARKVCTAEYINWKNNGTPSDIVINLIATHYSGWDKLDCTIKEYKPLTDQQIKKSGGGVTLAATEKAYGAYNHILNTNHGIKENNFRNMFIPLGITDRDYNETWLLSLNTFGQIRGSVAHSSKNVQQLLNPSDEKKTIIDVIEGTMLLDINIKNRLASQGTAMLARINDMQSRLADLDN
ncbi:hypothetical protein SMETH2_14940 [Serratia marcescens]|uniref:HEPN domain-containing protein n=1 Tax=Serratia ureilytica TaxID=300181 RepID=UPI00313B2093|nr:hypothetical protein SMETH2_14940 [Serratia marcescens]